jgi:hypothetical protein
LRDKKSFERAVAMAKLGGGWLGVKAKLDKGRPSEAVSKSLAESHFQAALARAQAREIEAGLESFAGGAGRPKIRLFALARI